MFKDKYRSIYIKLVFKPKSWFEQKHCLSFGKAFEPGGCLEIGLEQSLHISVDSVPKSMLGLHKDGVSQRLRNSEKDKYTTCSTFYYKLQGGVVVIWIMMEGDLDGKFSLFKL